jgi:hypothetical protein
MAVKRSITVTDLDDNEVTEDWYFSLGRTDVLEMNVVHDYADVPAYLTSIMKDAGNHSREILDLWKEMLFHSVGQREGNLLVKDEAIVRKFRFSGAFEKFLGELLEEDDAGASFFMSIMPSDVQEQIKTNQSKVYEKEEMLAMTDEEFDRLIGTDLRDMTKEQQLIAFQRRSGGKADAA